MNKKRIRSLILNFLVIFGIISFIPKVNAMDKEITGVDQSTCYSTVRMTRSSSQILFKGETRHVYFMNLGGEVGLCADPGKRMSSGTKLISGGCAESSISTKMKKALNYCASAGCHGDIEQIIAQVYAWGGSTLDMRVAICSYRNWPVFKNSKGQYLSDLTTQCRNLTEVNPSYRAIWTGLEKASSAGKFYCNTTGNPAYQRIATLRRPKCEVYTVSPDMITCPPGTTNAGMDITEQSNEIGYENAVLEYCGVKGAACVGYAVDLSGGLAICEDNNQTTSSTFGEVIGAGSPDYVGSATNGRKMDLNIGEGNYCAVYCLERKAIAILPGGLANPIAVGSALTWPTSEATSSSKWGNMFPVSFSGEKKCQLQVAPNLTYGNSCELYPIKQYEKYINEMRKYYDSEGKKYTALKNQGVKVNQGKYLDYSGDYVHFTAQNLEAPDILDRNNEEVRVDFEHQTTYLNKFEKYTVTEGSFFEGHGFPAKGKANAKSSKAAYETEWTTYCENFKYKPAIPHYTCSSGSESNGNCYNGSGQNIGAAQFSHYTCMSGRDLEGDRCRCNERAANNESEKVSTLNDIKTQWAKFESLIMPRYNRYKNYINAYQKALAIYHQIKLCQNFGTNSGDADKGGANFSCGGKTCDFYNFLTDAVMEYTDEGEYGATYGLVLEKDTNYSCTGCESDHSMKETDTLLKQKYTGPKNMFNSPVQGPEYMKNQIEKIENREIIIEASETTYSLPPNLYNYINKDTNKYVMNKPSGNFQTLGLSKNYDFLYSNLPTSYNNKVNKKYNLIIKSITLGDNGQFHAGAAGVSIGDYVCHYTVATDYDECLCPPGTKNEAVDLYQALLDSNGSLTCADAKLKYCNNDNVPECTTNCVIDKYCSNDITTKITACVNSGKSKADCESLLCANGKNYCPSGTKKAGMDITSCVQTKTAQGMRDARKYCENTICNGAVIVYRQIDLDNPFPSKDADFTVEQNNLRVGMFNLNVKGRYPGYNWNGPELVRKEIFRNRSVSTDQVYKQKPLYHFELNTVTIMDIREYNRKQAQNDDGYNDFTLSCVSDDQNKYLGTACLSEFVHNPKYGGDTTGNKSLCGGAGSTTSLANCLYNANN